MFLELQAQFLSMQQRMLSERVQMISLLSTSQTMLSMPAEAIQLSPGLPQEHLLHLALPKNSQSQARIPTTFDSDDAAHFPAVASEDGHKQCSSGPAASFASILPLSRSGGQQGERPASDIQSAQGKQFISSGEQQRGRWGITGSRCSLDSQ